MSEEVEFAIMAQGTFDEMHRLATLLAEASVDARVVEPPPNMASP